MLPAPAPVVIIHDDYGGWVAQFAARVADYRRHRVKVRIMGECASACTMVLGLDPSRVCAGPDAQLEFHQAYLPNRFDPLDTSIRVEETTQLLFQTYPLGVRAWISQHGGLTADLITLKGAELARLIPACRP